MRRTIQSLMIIVVLLMGINTLHAAEESPATLSTTPAQTSPCAGSPVTRLSIGMQGRVTPGLPNNMRESATTTSQRVGQIPAGGVFTVLYGPQCGNNLTWWQVNYNGVIGWTP